MRVLPVATAHNNCLQIRILHFQECFDPDNWHLSDRLDVYSFAIILCEMLTRRPPWHGASPMQVAYQVHMEVRGLAVGGSPCVRQ